MIETLGIDEWIYTTLLADGTIQAEVGSAIFADMAPQGTANPYILLAMQGAEDDNLVHGVRSLTVAQYQVKMVGQGMTYNALKAGADRIDTLLAGKLGTASVNGTKIQCMRISPLRYAEVSREGVQFRHLGGLYRIWAAGD